MIMTFPGSIDTEYKLLGPPISLSLSLSLSISLSFHAELPDKFIGCAAIEPFLLRLLDGFELRQNNEIGS
jgi:hypothetical protein